MNARVLVADPKKCTGCGMCEIACSIKQTGMSSPARSRIRIITWGDSGRYIPVTCQQCEEAPCVAVCPQKALEHDEKLKRVAIDYDKCISCRMCVAVCPYGAMGFEPDKGRIFKCDQCGGKPECVRWCEPEALAYVDTVADNLTRTRATARRMIPIKQS